MTIIATSPSGGKLYHTVAETLRREIEAGRFAESQLLPGERALCELLRGLAHHACARRSPN